ncbi:MAG: response regulator transcription factor [Chitinophagaceae bacterium]
MKNLSANNNEIKIGIVDDHAVFTNAVANLLNSQKDFSAMLLATSGKQLLQLLSVAPELPDILLLDVNMKDMNGIEIAKQVATTYPAIKMIALTATTAPHIIIQMIRAGCCAYLKKDIHPTQLEIALLEIHRKGKYYADIYNLHASSLARYERMEMKTAFSKKEILFLQLTSQGLSAREIGTAMNISPRTAVFYRSLLFEKLEVSSRITMTLEAIRLGLIKLDLLEEL